MHPPLPPSGSISYFQFSKIIKNNKKK
jgi:hypothetical protein